MNVQATSADFRRAMTIANKVVERRNTIPILSTVRCRANGKLEMTGTDLDIQLTASVPRVAGADATFAIMSPSEVVASIKEGGGDNIDVASTDTGVAIKSGTLSLKVGTLHVEDFPMDCDRALDATFTATLSAEHIRAMSRVSSAISTEETRYYLNGINIKRLDSGLFRIAATDGHRLCFVDLAWPDAKGDIGDIIIPRKAVRLLIELGSDAKDGLKFTVGTVPPANRDDSTAPARSGAPRLSIGFDNGRAAVMMISKLIDGTYPDYARVVPTSNDKQMLFKVADLRRALRGVSGHSKKYRALCLQLTNEGATVSSKYVDLDLAASATVPCEHNHAGFEIGFNGSYLHAMLDAAQGEEIVLTAADASAPVLVKNPADTEWTGILMPMRVWP